MYIYILVMVITMMVCSSCFAPRTHVESLAFKHLSQEVSQVRVDGVTDAFLELMEQNVSHLPPGSTAAWRQVLNYAGSAFSFVHDSHLLLSS